MKASPLRYRGSGEGSISRAGALMRESPLEGAPNDPVIPTRDDPTERIVRGVLRPRAV